MCFKFIKCGKLFVVEANVAWVVHQLVPLVTSNELLYLHRVLYSTIYILFLYIVNDKGKTG